MSESILCTNGRICRQSAFPSQTGARAAWYWLKGRIEERGGTHLPVVAKDDKLLCERAEIMVGSKLSRRYFTDATLLSAMTEVVLVCAG